jgi:nucleoid DNA-binding protein
MSEVNILTVINKLRPKIERNKIIKINHLVDEVIEETNLNRRDARDFAKKFIEVIVKHLKKADYVKLEEVGSLSVSCDKDQKLRVNYRASKSIGTALNENFQGKFENAENVGLDEEGYARRWIELNPGDTVIMRDKSPRTA